MIYLTNRQLVYLFLAAVVVCVLIGVWSEQYCRLMMGAGAGQ
jgi:hypothetical protein